MNSVVHALVAKAEEGDIPAIREIADRIEGKVQSQDASNNIKVIILNPSQPVEVKEFIDAEAIDGQT
jgi:hypothetical protein